MENTLEYNTSRPHLNISEYGRNIQKMIDYAITVEDRQKRNEEARAIIDVMGQLNPHLRDVTDFKHKLWDHLFIIADFKLDVDSPYPKPSPETLSEKPDKLNYPHQNIKFLHYGKNVELLINKAVEMNDESEKKQLVEIIANQMKKFYLLWNRDTVSDALILDQLKMLSKNKLNTDGIRLSYASDMSRNNNNGLGKKKKRNDKDGGHKMRKKY